ncbi:hypothetical protein DFJ74DRAFT_694220 [Hyaloraphidium curvatum]|nr:hypothetical protein DFJ74DRAFT_694220 [Hyaloraphidium curvatum]
MGADGKFVSQLAEVDLAVSYVSGNEIWTANPSKGTCSGDEGGPLVLDVAGNKTVVGMSLYHSCGSTTDTRSLFVRLSQYADAIASAVDLVTGRRTRTTTSTQTTATMTRRTMTVNPAVKRICKTSAVPIPEYGKASFNLPVSGVGSIGSVAVELDLTHSYMSDLEISIRHPAGGTVALFQHSVSCGHASGRPNSYPPLFFDDSTDPDMYCNYGYDPSMGPELYKPVGELSRFKGLVANGTWNLLVNDTAQGDEGTIRSVCLHILPVQSSKTVTVTVSRCTKSVTRTLVSSKCTKTSTLSKCTKTVQRTTSRWTTRTVTLKTATRTRVVTRTITATVKTT